MRLAVLALPSLAFFLMTAFADSAPPEKESFGTTAKDEKTLADSGRFCHETEKLTQRPARLLGRAEDEILARPQRHVEFERLERFAGFRLIPFVLRAIGRRPQPRLFRTGLNGGRASEMNAPVFGRCRCHGQSAFAIGCIDEIRFVRQRPDDSRFHPFERPIHGNDLFFPRPRDNGSRIDDVPFGGDSRDEFLRNDTGHDSDA